MASALRNREQLATFFNDNLAVETFLKVESLRSDLKDVLKEVHPEFDFQATDFASGKRINTSNRASAETYFDQASYDLISDQDALIFDYFGYKKK